MDSDRLIEDVYYSRAYAEVNRAEGEGYYEFYHRDGDRWFYHSALKRPVPDGLEASASESRFDLETPYGFGGPITNSPDRDFVHDAIQEHSKKARDEGAVGEFIRFHPFGSFPRNFPDSLEMIAHERNTVSIPFHSTVDEIFADFRSSLRRNVRKAMRNDLGFKEVTHELDLDDLLELYHGMVHRKGMDESYLFSREYFQQLLALDETRVFSCTVNGHIANYILVLDSPPLLHYHLGATREEYYALQVNPYCFYKIIELFHEDREEFFLGGGSSPETDDPLFRFKAKFSDRILPFYIGGLVHDRSSYDALCKAWEERNPERRDLKRILKYRF